MGKMHEGSRKLFTGRSLGRWRVPAAVILGAGLLIGAVGTAVVGTARPAGAQTVSAVTFGGTPASPTITVWGSGFGSESDLGTPQPAGGTSDCVYPPYTGSDYTNNLYFADNTQGWTAGQGSGGGGDCVGLLISSYSDNQITFGLGSGYTLAGYGQVHNGDSYALTVLGVTYSGTVAYPPSSASGVGTTAYVTDPGPNTITPIDTDTNTAGTPFNFAPYEPGAIAITPNGQTAYVAPVASDSVAEVTPIQTDTNTVGTPIDTVDPVSALAISPDGSTIYAVSGSDNAVVPIDVATGTAGTPIPVGEDPSAVAFTPDGTMAYVTNYDDSSVTPIDVATGTAEPPIGVNFFPTGIAITPDGSTAYVVNSGNQTVTAIDLATQAISSPIFVGTNPVAIAITPDGSTAYVVNNGDGTVTPIDTSTDVAGTAITVGSSPEAIAITPDGSTAYVADGTDDATPIDTASNTAGTPVNAGDDPVGIAITPDQAPSANLSASTSGHDHLLRCLGFRPGVLAHRHLRLELRRREHPVHHHAHHNPYLRHQRHLHSHGDRDRRRRSVDQSGLYRPDRQPERLERRCGLLHRGHRHHPLHARQQLSGRHLHPGHAHLAGPDHHGHRAARRLAIRDFDRHFGTGRADLHDQGIQSGAGGHLLQLHLRPYDQCAGHRLHRRTNVEEGHQDLLRRFDTAARLPQEVRHDPGPPLRLPRPRARRRAGDPPRTGQRPEVPDRRRGHPHGEPEVGAGQGHHRQDPHHQGDRPPGRQPGHPPYGGLHLPRRFDHRRGDHHRHRHRHQRRCAQRGGDRADQYRLAHRGPGQ